MFSKLILFSTYFFPLFLCTFSTMILPKAWEATRIIRVTSLVAISHSLFMAGAHHLFIQGDEFFLLYHLLVLVIAVTSFLFTFDPRPYIAEEFVHAVGVLLFGLAYSTSHALFHTAATLFSQGGDLGYFGSFHRGLVHCGRRLVGGAVGLYQGLFRGPTESPTQPGNPPPPPPPPPPPTTDPNSSSGATEASLPPPYTSLHMLTFHNSPEAYRKV